MTSCMSHSLTTESNIFFLRRAYPLQILLQVATAFFSYSPSRWPPHEESLSHKSKSRLGLDCHLQLAQVLSLLLQTQATAASASPQFTLTRRPESGTELAVYLCCLPLFDASDSAAASLNQLHATSLKHSLPRIAVVAHLKSSPLQLSDPTTTTTTPKFSRAPQL